ncbi:MULTISPECIES: signal peptidase II [Prochlorococcus]|uniref:signal peptidase II n=1 Tax=Prochlorococcus TaxID=1218 RepID=UPI0005339D5F|nr:MULTISPECIES: signal peptidase II [Prochlorococcus]KGG12323.1 Lipoprotein signal peptidase [Prochlorococcus sp. MIT 0601]
MNKSHIINRNYILLIGCLVALIDQISKFFIYSILKDGEIFVVLPKLIQFRIAKNYGAAFSILSSSTLLLAIISLIASSVIIIYTRYAKPMHKLQGLGLSFLLGGCIGNGIDRWLLGYVIDFIDLIPIDFPIFNIADIAINIGVILLFLSKIIKSKGYNHIRHI